MYRKLIAAFAMMANGVLAVRAFGRVAETYAVGQTIASELSGSLATNLASQTVVAAATDAATGLALIAWPVVLIAREFIRERAAGRPQ